VALLRHSLPRLVSLKNSAMKRNRVLLLILITLMLGDFIARGVIPAFAFDKNDFSDPFCASWLWRHGENPYDVALATGVNTNLVHSHIIIVPVYPPTTYLLMSPFSMLPWKWANFIFSILSFVGVLATVFLLLRIAGFTTKEDSAWFLAAVVCTFAPFHTGLHVANLAIITTALCLFAIYLADKQHDIPSGIVLAITACLKPQVGIWILIFYVVRRRWMVVIPAMLGGFLLAGMAVVRIPLSPAALILNYKTNLHYWFGPGGANDFTAANLWRFELVNAQVVLHSLVHSIPAANALAWGLFAIGFVIWLSVVLRSRNCPEPLALASLLALGFLPVYHRAYDTAILTLALCWALRPLAKLNLASKVILISLLPLVFPGESLFMRTMPHLPAWVIASWWWDSGLAAHAVWAVLLLNVALLYALVLSSSEAKEKSQSDIAHITPFNCNPDVHMVEA